MKKLSLAVIGCVVLAGCAQPQQSTPPAASKSALPPIVQTVTQDEESIQQLQIAMKKKGKKRLS